MDLADRSLLLQRLVAAGLVVLLVPSFGAIGAVADDQPAGSPAPVADIRAVALPAAVMMTQADRLQVQVQAETATGKNRHRTMMAETLVKHRPSADELQAASGR